MSELILSPIGLSSSSHAPDSPPDFPKSFDENPFETLFANVSEPMWIFDLETWRFLDVNEAMILRYGYSREELLGGMTAGDIRSPEEKDRLRHFIDITPGNFQEVGVFQHRIRSGKIINVNIASYLFTYRGRPARLVRATSAEPRVEARDETAPGETTAVHLLETIGDLVARFDRDWRFLDANRVLTVAMGTRREDLVGKELWTELPQLRNTPFEWNLRDAMVNRHPVRFTARGPRSHRWFEIHASPEGDGISVLTRDISERKSAESRNEELQAQLRHAQRMETLGEMVSGIAHDFNNLLTIMAGSVDRLKSLGTDQPDARATTVSRLDDAIERAAELSRRLLSYSRNDPTLFRKIDINRCVAQTLAMATESTDRRIEFATELDQDCRFVYGDAHQVELVFMNLIINACDALLPRLARSSSGKVRIKSWRGVIPDPLAATEGLDADLEYLCLLFEDNGEGIPDSIRSRVFEPYFTTKPENRGTGLGLSISRGTIRAHGGAMAVESDPGQGTRFFLYLPVFRAPVPQAASGIALERPRARARILAVEDEEPLRELLEEVLSPLGYELVLAENGRRGVELFTSEPDSFDVVLLDLNMPGLNGISALRAIRAVRPQAKILMITGYADERLARDLGKESLQGVLYKPYPPSELVRRLSLLLSSSLN